MTIVEPTTHFCLHASNHSIHEFQGDSTHDPSHHCGTHYNHLLPPYTPSFKSQKRTEVLRRRYTNLHPHRHPFLSESRARVLYFLPIPSHTHTTKQHQSNLIPKVLTIIKPSTTPPAPHNHSTQTSLLQSNPTIYLAPQTIATPFPLPLSRRNPFYPLPRTSHKTAALQCTGWRKVPVRGGLGRLRGKEAGTGGVM